MRVNVYAEEMTDRVEIIGKEIDGQEFTGLRFYLHLPATVPTADGKGTENVSGPFMHRPGDDDSAAVTFWGKRDLRETLRLAMVKLDKYYGQPAQASGPVKVDDIRELVDSISEKRGPEKAVWFRVMRALAAAE